MQDPKRIDGESQSDYAARLQSARASENERKRKAANLRRRVEADQGRYVFAERPRCDRCRSVELKPYRTTTDGETISRYVECKSCGEKFILILE